MTDRQEERADGPLETERGETRISESAVARVVGLAAREVTGVHMDAENETRGVNVEVGRTETAVDLKMAVDYAARLPELTRSVRETVGRRVETLLGLKVTECNITVDRIVFPAEDGRRERRAELQDTGEREEIEAAGRREEEVGGRETVALGDQETLHARPGDERPYGVYGEEPRAEDERPYGAYADDTRSAEPSGSIPAEQRFREGYGEADEAGTDTDRDETADATGHEEVRVEGEPLRPGEGADLESPEEEGFERYRLDEEEARRATAEEPTAETADDEETSTGGDAPRRDDHDEEEETRRG